MWRGTFLIVRGRGYQLELSLPDVLTRERFCRVTAVKDDQLVASWKSEAVSDIVPERGRVSIAIVFKLSRRSTDQHQLSIHDKNLQGQSVIKVPLKCRSGIYLRCELELLRLRARVCMSAIIYNCKILRTIVFVAKVRQFFVQGSLPTVGRDLVVFRPEVEFSLE